MGGRGSWQNRGEAGGRDPPDTHTYIIYNTHIVHIYKVYTPGGILSYLYIGGRAILHHPKKNLVGRTICTIFVTSSFHIILTITLKPS
jgi:hypothetical protein